MKSALFSFPGRFLVEQVGALRSALRLNLGVEKRVSAPGVPASEAVRRTTCSIVGT